MEKTAKGMAYVFGNNVDTDQIYPGKYVEYTEMEDIRKYAMSGSEMPDFAKVFQLGDIIVGGTNFGCGSSREHAVMTLKGVGAGAILAESFARIFYRNSINIGLAIVECPLAAEEISEGDMVSVDMDSGVITDLTTGKNYSAEPFPPFIQEIISAGGLVEAMKRGIIK